MHSTSKVEFYRYEYPSSFRSWIQPIVLFHLCGFPGDTSGKNLPAKAGDERDTGSIPGSGRSPGGGNWQSTPVFLPEKFHRQEEPGRLQVYGIAKSQTEQLSARTHTHMHL